MSPKEDKRFVRDVKTIKRLIERDTEPIDEKGTIIVARSKDPWVGESYTSHATEESGYPPLFQVQLRKGRKRSHHRTK